MGAARRGIMPLVLLLLLHLVVSSDAGVARLTGMDAAGTVTSTRKILAKSSDASNNDLSESLVLLQTQTKLEPTMIASLALRAVIILVDIYQFLKNRADAQKLSHQQEEVQAEWERLNEVLGQQISEGIRVVSSFNKFTGELADHTINFHANDKCSLDTQQGFSYYRGRSCLFMNVLVEHVQRTKITLADDDKHYDELQSQLDAAQAQWEMLKTRSDKLTFQAKSMLLTVVDSLRSMTWSQVRYQATNALILLVGFISHHIMTVLQSMVAGVGLAMSGIELMQQIRAVRKESFYLRQAERDLENIKEEMQIDHEYALCKFRRKLQTLSETVDDPVRGLIYASDALGANEAIFEEQFLVPMQLLTNKISTLFNSVDDAGDTVDICARFNSPTDTTRFVSPTSRFPLDDVITCAVDDEARGSCQIRVGEPFFVCGPDYKALETFYPKKGEFTVEDKVLTFKNAASTKMYRLMYPTETISFTLKSCLDQFQQALGPGLHYAGIQSSLVPTDKTRVLVGVNVVEDIVKIPLPVALRSAAARRLSFVHSGSPDGSSDSDAKRTRRFSASATTIESLEKPRRGTTGFTLAESNPLMQHLPWRSGNGKGLTEHLYVSSRHFGTDQSFYWSNSKGAILRLDYAVVSRRDLQLNYHSNAPEPYESYTGFLQKQLFGYLDRAYAAYLVNSDQVYTPFGPYAVVRDSETEAGANFVTDVKEIGVRLNATEVVTASDGTKTLSTVTTTVQVPLKLQLLLMKQGFGPPIVDVRLCSTTTVDSDGFIVYPAGYIRAPIWTSDTVVTALIGASRKRKTVLCYARDLYLPPVPTAELRKEGTLLVAQVDAITEMEVAPPSDVNICSSRRNPELDPRLAMDWDTICAETVTYRTAVYLASLRPLFAKHMRASRAGSDSSPRAEALRQFAGYLKSMIARRAIFAYLHYPHMLTKCVCDSGEGTSHAARSTAFFQNTHQSTGYLQLMEETLNDRTQISLDYPTDPATNFYEMLEMARRHLIRRIPARQSVDKDNTEKWFNRFDVEYRALVFSEPDEVFNNYKNKIAPIAARWPNGALVAPYIELFGHLATKFEPVAIGGDLALALLPSNVLRVSGSLPTTKYPLFLLDSIKAPSYRYLALLSAWKNQVQAVGTPGVKFLWGDEDDDDDEELAQFVRDFYLH